MTYQVKTLERGRWQIVLSTHNSSCADRRRRNLNKSGKVAKVVAR